MRAKINLLALMELVFKAPAHQRSLSFSLIAATARIPNNEVGEWREFVAAQPLALN